MRIDTWGISEKTYTLNVQQKISDKYNFDLETTNFEWWIQKAGALYLLDKEIPYARERRKEEIARLKRIQRLSRKLLVDAVEIQKDDFIRIGQLGRKLDIQPPQRREGVAYNPLDLIGCHGDQWLEYIKLGEAHATQELEYMAQEKGGRPTLEGHYDFSRYLIDFWERQVDRRFTLDHNNQSGFTESYFFVKDCLSYLEPVDEKKLVSSIRRYLTEMRTYINPGKITS